MKRKYCYLILFLLIGAFVFSLVFFDMSPDKESYKTSYNGFPTTTLHDFKAHLSNDTDKIFWFVHVTDVHIGAYLLTGDNRKNFQDFFENMNHVNPNFIVDSGDLVNGEIPLPWRQDVQQWIFRNNTIAAANAYNDSYYYDILGNHDGYGEEGNWTHYLTWSVQKKLQYSWNRSFSFGNYTFIALNTAEDRGDFPYGTSGDLNQSELNWFEYELNITKDSNLTFVFGHHPEWDLGFNKTSTTNKGFIDLLEEYNVSAYGFGHNHENFERNQGGTICIGTDSMGQPSEVTGYRLFAVDNDGISTKFQPMNTWPAVMITCPIDRGLTMQSFDIPNVSTSVPIRVLVFDKNPVNEVKYKIDSGSWNSMSLVSGNLWNASFDASILTDEVHSLTVTASSASGVSSDSITFHVGNNSSPVIINGPIDNFERVENSAPWTLNLSQYEWDRFDNGTKLNWSVSNVDVNFCNVVISDIINDIATFTPAPNAFGKHAIVLTLNNSRGESISQIITIELTCRLDANIFQLCLIIVAFIIILAIALNLIRKSQFITRK
ncbi:MAG: metallophosphoesterase family protein [Candidatus Helarchaeota archaeon]